MRVVSLSNATVPSYRRIVVAVYGKLKMGQSVDFMQKYISNLIATYWKQLGHTELWEDIKVQNVEIIIRMNEGILLKI
jgi:hypothetical protein